MSITNFSRFSEKNIIKAIEEKQPIILIYGPRQAGKTTLVKQILAKIKEKNVLSYTGDDIFTQQTFSQNNLTYLKKIVGNTEILFLDEAQKIENIGLTLKLLADNTSILTIASGSSSFELANKLNEPLTGRTKTFWIYPLCYCEVFEKYHNYLTDKALEEMLIYGMYPKIQTLQQDNDKKDYLYEYISNYLYKDILTFSDVKKPKIILDLLTLLALQIGQEVRISELAQNLSISQKTVEKYLDVLEKMFIIYNLRGFSRNLRKEVSKTSKYYFTDIGIRNAILRNFNPLSLRNDTGEIFENWFIMEKIKKALTTKDFANYYFWRTYDQQEIDLIEEKNGKLTGFECKWKKTKIKIPKDWVKQYTTADFVLVNKENYSDLLKI